MTGRKACGRVESPLRAILLHMSDPSPKTTPKKGSRRWSLLSLTPSRLSLKTAPITPVDEAPLALDSPVREAASVDAPVQVEDSDEEDLYGNRLDSYVQGLRTSTTCWESANQGTAAPKRDAHLGAL